MRVLEAARDTQARVRWTFQKVLGRQARQDRGIYFVPAE
jgi:hypothetical protein